MATRKTRSNPSAADRTPGGTGSGAGADGDDLGGVVAQHERALDALGQQVQSLLARQEWIQSGLYDLNLSLTALAQPNGGTGPAATDDRLAYVESIRALREAVRRILPRDASLLVVSKGDDALLDLYGRRAAHFPQAADEGYAWHYLPDGTGLIAHLQVLRARGAQYLLFPRTALWWLESYPKFAQHLHRHYTLVVDDPRTGAIYSLQRYSPTDPSSWKLRITRVVEDYVAETGTEAAVLDLNTGLDLQDLLPNQAVFNPPTPDPELPYLDRSIDVVVGFSSDDEVVDEARRVAGHVVAVLEAVDTASAAQEAQDGNRLFNVRIERVNGESRAIAPSSSIVIPTYDGWKHLDLCLTALDDTLPEPFEGEVIVVDDASGQETQALLDRWKKAGSRLNLKVIRNESNCGFTESCNRGAAAAESDFLVFLNDDTLPQLGWLSALLRTFRDHEDVGAVGGKLLYPDGSLQEAGNVIFSDGAGANFGRGDYSTDDPLYSFVREVDYCSAALLATPRKLFEEIGGFDERYRPAYYEDTDYCFAVREHGRRVLYQPESAVVHTEGATSGTDLSSGVKKYQVVNQSKFVEKWQRQLEHQPSPPDRYDLRTLYALSVRPHQ